MAVTGPVFVAGATGYTGREVVRECLARGLETIAHVRPDSRRLDAWRKQFEAQGARVDTTPWELSAFKTTLEALQPTQIYALVGTTRARGKDGGSGSAVADNYEAVDYGLSVLLLEAALACGSNPRFVYLSALGADGRASSAYMGVRKRVEAAVRGSGLPFVFARPAFISGEDREESRPGERFAARTFDGVLGIARMLGAKRFVDQYSTVTGKQLAKAMVEVTCTTKDPTVIVEPPEILAALGR